jgi:hypothetical protein
MEEKTQKAVQGRYFHWRFRYTFTLLLILGIARFIGAITESWQGGICMILFLTTLFLIAYLPWNSEYNRFLKEGETEEEIGYRLRGNDRPIKVIYDRDPEPADSRRYHFRWKYLAVAICCFFVTVLVSAITGLWWGGLPLGLIMVSMAFTDYCSWNKSMRKHLIMGYTESEAREKTKYSGCGGGGGDDGDVFWDPTYSSLPYNAWHK